MAGWRVERSGIEITSAGRFFVAVRSVKGKGTRTTVYRSKVTVGLIVGGARPFAQGGFDRAQILDVQRLHPADGGCAVVSHLPGDQVTGADVQGGANPLGMVVWPLAVILATATMLFLL